jgi:hypothetical protein
MSGAPTVFVPKSHCGAWADVAKFRFIANDVFIEILRAGNFAVQRGRL